MGGKPLTSPTSPPAAVAKTGSGLKSHNTFVHQDYVFVVFDEEVPEDLLQEEIILFWVQRSGTSKEIKKKRAKDEVSLGASHKFILFEGLKPGLYKLVRKSQGLEQTLFSKIPYPYHLPPKPPAKQGAPQQATPAEDERHGLVGLGKGPALRLRKPYDEKIIDEYKEPEDQDLKGDPPRFAKLTIEEPQLLPDVDDNP